MNKEEAARLLNIYGKAWVTRDPDLIISIFTEDATYDDPHEPKNIGLDAIRSYWITKVIGEQENIIFNIKNIWIDGETVLAEWHVEFTDIKKNLRVKMDEVAIFTVRDGKFSSLREYYKTEKTPL